MKVNTRVNKPKSKYKYKLPKGQYLRKFNEYDETFPEAAYDILSKGGCQEDIMADFKIGKETFYRWKKEIEPFADAIRTGIAASKQWHMNYMKANLDNRNYNERAHGRLLRMAFNVPEEAYSPLPELKEAKNAVERSNMVLGAIADGKITAKQGSDIGISILNDVKAEEATDLKRDIEELKEKMSKGT